MKGSFMTGWNSVARLFRPRMQKLPLAGEGAMAGEHVRLDIEADAARRLSEELSKLQDTLILKPFGVLKAGASPASEDHRVGGRRAD